MTLGIPVLKRAQEGEATVISLVKYRPQSVPANTCWGKLGLAMMESTGMLGRLPLLLTQLKVAQLAVHVTWNTCPWVLGVFSLKPPTAAYPTNGFTGSVATSRMGRLGSTALPPVTLTQVAVLALPCP